MWYNNQMFTAEHYFGNETYVTGQKLKFFNLGWFSISFVS